MGELKLSSLYIDISNLSIKKFQLGIRFRKYLVCYKISTQWLVQFNPNIFKQDLLVIVLPAQKTSRVVVFKTSLHFDPNMIDSVFPRWREGLLSVSHFWWNRARFCCLCCICAIFVPTARIAESSAYKNSKQLTAEAMSFTYMRNSNGPAIDPLGMPQLTAAGAERVSPISTHCCLPFR